MKNVIFDLDGDLIDDRRKISTKDNGKIDWDVFFDPKNIDLDKPNLPVIKVIRCSNRMDLELLFLVVD